MRIRVHVARDDARDLRAALFLKMVGVVDVGSIPARIDLGGGRHHAVVVRRADEVVVPVLGELVDRRVAGHPHPDREQATIHVHLAQEQRPQPSAGLVQAIALELMGVPDDGVLADAGRGSSHSIDLGIILVRDDADLGDVGLVGLVVVQRVEQRRAGLHVVGGCGAGRVLHEQQLRQRDERGRDRQGVVGSPALDDPDDVAVGLEVPPGQQRDIRHQVEEQGGRQPVPLEVVQDRGPLVHRPHRHVDFDPAARIGRAHVVAPHQTAEAVSNRRSLHDAVAGQDAPDHRLLGVDRIRPARRRLQDR